MKLKLLQAIITFVVLFQSSTGYACTTAFWNNNGIAKVAARSMDLYISDQPMMVIYSHGISREGNVKDNLLKWTSKYGSVVVTAFHSNAVSDGINEKGLAAHLLYLHTTQYESRDKTKPAISNIEWVQYILDNFSTVDEVVKHHADFQVVSGKINNREWPLHLTVEDPTGDSAVIEFVKGKMIIHHGKQYTVMSNEPAYDLQLKNLKQYRLFGGKLSMPGDIDPLSRFVRASSYLKTLPQPQNEIAAIAGILSVIRTVMTPFGAVDTSGGASEDAWPTRWISMSDLTNKAFYFSSTTTPNIIWVNLSNVSFDASNPVLELDPVDINLIGEVSAKFKERTGTQALNSL